jgi:thiol:disulfide interchange protein
MRDHDRVFVAAEGRPPGGTVRVLRRVVLASAAGVLAMSLGCGPRDEVDRGATPELAWSPSYQVALHQAAELTRPVMVDFYTDWCGWCRRLDRTTLADGRVRRALERFVLVKLNAEKEGSEAADRFGVRAYPTVVFLNAAGQEVGRIPGYLEADGFLQELEEVLKKT